MVVLMMSVCILNHFRYLPLPRLETRRNMFPIDGQENERVVEHVFVKGYS